MGETKLLTTDVLVIGGGICGLVSANKALDQGAEVLITDKGVSPWVGQVPSGGGGFPCALPDQVEAQAEHFCERGEYLNDQDWTHTLAKDAYTNLLEMSEWGDIFRRDVSGKVIIGRFPFGAGAVLSLYRTEMCLPILLGRALKKGAQILNRIYTVGLLKRDGRVVGAVGFHYQTGDFYVIQSKATIIACGGANYKARQLFHMNCGEGIAMAYDAGAELRNAEFGNTYMISNKYTKADDRGADALKHCWENALGEVLTKKYPELAPPLLVMRPCVNAFRKEVEAGRGPIYMNLVDRVDQIKHPEFTEDLSPSNTSHGNRTHGYIRMMIKLGIDVNKQKVEWTVVPEFHGGPIRINTNCETTVPGLYATGDATQNGSGYMGAFEPCGAWPPLGYCVVTGFKAGTAAGKASLTTPQAKAKRAEVENLKKEIFAPLNAKGSYSPYDAIKEIQEIVFPLKNSYVKSEDRLENALNMLEKVKAKLPNLAAKDSHELVRCHEAKAMIMNAEALYRASLVRTETRGSNIREDYPERDDKNWLKWIIAKKEGGEMKLWTEPIPIKKYKYKPDSLR